MKNEKAGGLMTTVKIIILYTSTELHFIISCVILLWKGNHFRESSHWHASLETPGLMEISTYCTYAGVSREPDIPWSKHSSCGLISGPLISGSDFLLL